MSGHRRATACALVPMLLVLLASSGAAQTRVATAAKPSAATTLKNALRSVAAAQKDYRARRGRYAESVQQLGLRLEPEIAVEITATGPTGWQARAAHREQEGKSCVIFGGSIAGREAPRTEEDREMAGEDGVPLCDRMR
jgi:hypothetical protein